MSSEKKRPQPQILRIALTLSAFVIMGAAIVLFVILPDVGRMDIIAGVLFGIGLLELIVTDFIFTKKSKFTPLKYLLLIGILLGAAFALLLLLAHQRGKQTLHATPAGNAFFVLGDSRTGHDIYKAIVASIAAARTTEACLINTGDLISTAGHPEQWLRFLKMTAPIAAIMPWYAAVGNHEVNSAFSQKMYQWIMDLPGNELYYSFETLNSHFIMLDTEIPGEKGAIRGAQLAWLKQDLQTAAPTSGQIFVFTHRPFFPQGNYRDSPLANADELHRLFRQYHVALVFSGHEHQYYTLRKDTVTYVVTAGAGAPLSRVGPGTGFHHYLRVELLTAGDIRIQVFDMQGKIIQTEVIKKAAR